MAIYNLKQTRLCSSPVCVPRSLSYHPDDDIGDDDDTMIYVGGSQYCENGYFVVPLFGW